MITDLINRYLLIIKIPKIFSCGNNKFTGALKENFQILVIIHVKVIHNDQIPGRCLFFQDLHFPPEIICIRFLFLSAYLIYHHLITDQYLNTVLKYGEENCIILVPISIHILFCCFCFSNAADPGKKHQLIFRKYMMYCSEFFFSSHKTGWIILKRIDQIGSIHIRKQTHFFQCVHDLLHILPPWNGWSG